jgi:hypothetical protein
MQHFGTPVYFAQWSNHLHPNQHTAPQLFVWMSYQWSESRCQQINRQGYSRLGGTHIEFPRNRSQRRRHDGANHDAVEACCGKHVCDSPFAARGPIFGIVDIEGGTEGYEVGVIAFGSVLLWYDGELDVWKRCDGNGVSWMCLSHFRVAKE